MISRHATVIPRPAAHRMRKLPIYGVAIHTTGSGLPSKAVKAGRDPLEYAVDYYRGSGGPTYVVGWSGDIRAIFPTEEMETWHISIESAEVKPIGDGSWRQLVSAETAAQWDRRWGANRNPRDLIAGALPNQVTIGIETIPVTSGGSAKPWHAPMRPGLRFSREQHDALRDLVADIARRYGWSGNWRRDRVFGHEDLNPIRRHDSRGGWDPGWLRAKPYMDRDHITGGEGMSPEALVALLLAGGALVLG